MSSARYMRASSRGSALIVALIMLILLMLFAVSSFNMGKSNLEIVGNAQQDRALVTNANSAIQEAISTTRLFQSPDTVFLVPCATANTRCYDASGVATTDPAASATTVTLTPPTCVKANIKSNSSLDLTKSDDAGCVVGSPQTWGIVGSVSDNSLCSDTLWNVNAVAVDNVSKATVTVTEGVSVRVSTATVATVCP